MGKYTSKLQDKRVLVIGGTAGIGFGVAEACIEFGAYVTVASSQQANVDKAIKSIQTSYPEAKDRINGLVCDLTAKEVTENLTKLLDFATNKNTAKLDHIVDTAGAVHNPMNLSNVNPEGLHDFFNARIVPLMMLAKLAPTYLKSSYESSLTLTGGSVVYKPMAGAAVLGAIAGTRDPLVRGLARDMVPIRVNLVSPGAIRTALLEKIAGGMWVDPNMKPDIEKNLDVFAQMAVQKRVGTVEDCVEGYLCCLRAYFTTGSVVHTEGGYLLM
jgi:NAD(P)-dependent dehydrogenase (short-subunit alcohol dehydrogenase family)